MPATVESARRGQGVDLNKSRAERACSFRRFHWFDSPDQRLKFVMATYLLEFRIMHQQRDIPVAGRHGQAEGQETLLLIAIGMAH